jgi:hypothetical protein
MAMLIRAGLFFLLGAAVMGLFLAAFSAFVLGDVDPDFSHQPFAAFTNLVMRNLLAAVVQSAIFGLGLLAARLLFAWRMAENELLAWILGAFLVLLNFLLSLTVRKVLDRNYDLAALVYLLVVPLVLAFVFPALSRKWRIQLFRQPASESF